MKKVFYSYFSKDDINNIVSSLEDKKEYVCTIPYPDNTSELLLSRVVSTLISKVECGNHDLKIAIILNELIMNAHRINLIGKFFEQHNLDINNETDFKYAQNNIQHDFFSKTKPDKNQYIKIRISVRDRELYINIENSREISLYENNCFKKLMSYGERYKDTESLFYDNPDITDRVDFGLILSIFMLKQINISPDSLIIYPNNGGTTTELTIPFLQLSKEIVVVITDEIANDIKSLPQLPDSIVRLQREILDPEWDYEHITDSILSDTALTTEILRLVNSPVYRVGKKVDTISMAVRKIGINGLRNLLYNFGSLKILESKYNIDKIDKFKKHLFQVALISSYIAKDNNYNNFSEDTYIAALMHDIGKMILLSINNDIYSKIKNYCDEMKIPHNVLEMLTNGYNHSLIGARLAEKWRFPTKYMMAIEYHHLPTQVPEEYKVITYCVYLANEVCQIFDERGKYSNINSTVLKFFNLNDVESFDKFLLKLKNEGLII